MTEPRQPEERRDRDRERDRKDRVAQRKRGRGRPGVPLALALAAVVLALGGGVAIGYVVRGEPPPSSLETVEREVPVVTVTVPEGSNP